MDKISLEKLFLSKLGRRNKFFKIVGRESQNISNLCRENRNKSMRDRTTKVLKNVGREN